MKKVTPMLFFAIALTLANTVFAQTKVGELTNINGSCSLILANPGEGTDSYHSMTVLGD